MSDVIAIVSGLPRSGTSMMMKMLEAGGMEVVVDNLREADEDNPMGYYELETVKQIKGDASWLNSVQGKVVKMVSMLLYDLPLHKNYKVIFMLRKMEEIIASQQKMLERKGDRNVTDDEEMIKLYNTHIQKIEKWLEQQENIEVLYLNYKDIIENPHKNAQMINKFLNNTLNVERMVQTVDKSLYRQRRSNDNNPDIPTREQDIKDIIVKKEHDQEKIEAQLRSLGYM
jgi:hypothetical protein